MAQFTGADGNKLADFKSDILSCAVSAGPTSLIYIGVEYLNSHNNSVTN